MGAGGAEPPEPSLTLTTVCMSVYVCNAVFTTALDCSSRVVKVTVT